MYSGFAFSEAIIYIFLTMSLILGKDNGESHLIPVVVVKNYILIEK
jgi:hypothetical protein